MARNRRRRQSGRPVNGILLLDKPTGVSSNGALQDVKRLFRAQKAGHTGSLDPLASGLLPICFGEATKISAYLLDADKEYQLTARFGLATSTGDADGEVIEDCLNNLPERAAVEIVLPAFTGAIEQIPPMYSALHHKGRRLYELAREGIEVEREPRPVTIYALTLLDWNPHPESGISAAFKVRCSKGTYVRTLVEDIAKAVDCCAYVTSLRRIGVGPFPAEQMVTTDTITEAVAENPADADRLLLPIQSAVAHWPVVELDAELARYIRQGHPVLVPKAPDHEGYLQLLDEQGGFIGVGEVDDNGQVAPRRLIRQ